MAQHFIEYGSCGHVITQCRCPGPKEERRLWSVCYNCLTAAQTMDAMQPTALQDEDFPRLQWWTPEQAQANEAALDELARQSEEDERMRANDRRYRFLRWWFSRLDVFNAPLLLKDEAHLDAWMAARPEWESEA